MLAQLAFGLLLVAGDPNPVRIVDARGPTKPVVRTASATQGVRYRLNDRIRQVREVRVVQPPMVPDPIAPNEQAAEGHQEADSGKDTGEKVISSSDCCNNCRHGGPSPCKEWLFGRCDMPQHMPYFPAQHGYYYFRPYNYSNLQLHKDFVASFGADPRNPYDNKLFADVYAKIHAEEEAKKAMEKKKPEALPKPEEKKKPEAPKLP